MTPESQKSTEYADFPKDEYAQLIRAKLSPHGTFVHADPPKHNRSVLLVKTVHGRPENVDVFSLYPELLTRHLKHQDAIYDTYKAVSRTFGIKTRFVMERIPQPLLELSENIKLELWRSAQLQNSRLRGETELLRKVLNQILQKNHAAPLYLQMLNGSQRFIAQCFGRYNDFILPGGPHDEGVETGDTLDILNKELKQLVQSALSHGIQEEELTVYTNRARKLIIDDHKIRHAHVQVESLRRGIEREIMRIRRQEMSSVLYVY